VTYNRESGLFSLLKEDKLNMLGEKLEVQLQSEECAVLLNSGDQGYGIFIMDDYSVFFFEKHLSSIYN
jgi:hypothetical protein